jgi:hypothetical protein
MSVQSEIARISENVQNSLNAVAEQGVSVPAGATSDNLAELIATIGNDCSIKVSKSGTVTTLTVTDKSGTQSVQIKDGTDGKTPTKGTDYFTEADKAELVQMVIESLGGNPIFGYVDENNNVILSGNLADGTYSIKYETEDGTIDIGNLVLDNNVYYSVTSNLTNCTNSNSATEVVEGESYSATITANSGYELKTGTVTMGGQAVSVSGGNISIANVTGDIVITAVAEQATVEIVNQIPLSTDASGNPYNNGQGWKTGYRLSSSSGNESTQSGIEVTGFIPCKYTDTLYIKDMIISSANTQIWCVYDSSYAKLKGGYMTNMFGENADGVVDSVTLSDYLNDTTCENLAYIRVSAAEITTDSIITVNQEIV